MGKSDLNPQTPPKKRVRPISNPLYDDDETFFCNIITHHHLRPGEQFPAFPRLYSVSFEHEARFYLECQTFYAFTLDSMNPEESKKSTKDAPSPCQVVVRPKSYKKPAKYDIQPLPPIDESSESIEERLEHAGPSVPTQTIAGYDIDHSNDDLSSSMTSSLHLAVPPTNGTLSLRNFHPPVPPLSPMSQMIQDLENSPSGIPADSNSNKSLDTIHGNEPETPIANSNGIASFGHDGMGVINIHPISTNPTVKGFDSILLTSRFPNLLYDAQFDRYIKKPNPDEKERGSRLNVDLQINGVCANADGVDVKGEKGKIMGKLVVLPEVAIMKYTTPEGATGVRSLRMKPQVQDNGLYRVAKNATGIGEEEVDAKKHVRMASEPERIATPGGADQPIGRLRSDTEPIKRISRHPYANISRRIEDSLSSPRQDSRRRKAGPIYLPACTENDDTNSTRLFIPTNTRTRTPSPRIRPIRPPPPTDRPYRYISQRSVDSIPRVDNPPSQDRGSTGDDPSPIVVDITSFVPPQTTIASSTSRPESPVRHISYTLNLPQIFSSPSPIALPSKPLSAVPATPITNPNPNSHISSISISDPQIATANSSIYSIYTPESSPHSSGVIPPTLSRIPSIPSPPNTPKASLFRSNTVSTIPSTPTKTDTDTHTRHNTNSTFASSISSPNNNPNPSPIKPNPRPSPHTHTRTLSQESIALTEHLVREGIYGGIVYDISTTKSPSKSPSKSTSQSTSQSPISKKPQPNNPNPSPHWQLTASQLRRKKKRAAKVLSASLRKREKEAQRAHHVSRNPLKNHSEKCLWKLGLRAKTRNVKAAVQSQRGKVSYVKIRVFLRRLGRGVQVRYQGFRKRVGEVVVARERILGAVRPERWRGGVGMGVGVGDQYDFVCRGESGSGSGSGEGEGEGEDRNKDRNRDWVDVRDREPERATPGMEIIG
ncbi:hypothetical protein SBOR_3486 [Sclerotinia borealis F-4128]|uniref:Uncharacterized protein n=1 Tax=Sclerotinia borealis (strain F-4128) TaxID=1432307 RepID=W9CNQ4_SCLBF|nr:hypothetical protein SBOR_3486 [Sclerotinia borealis F-4128]